MSFAAIEDGRVVYTSDDDLPDDDLYTYVAFSAPLPARPGPNTVLAHDPVAGFHWRDPRSVEQCRADRWDEIKAQRDLLDWAPIEVATGVLLDADTQAKQDLMGAIMAMQLTGATSRAWRCADNVMRELTMAQIVSAGVAVANRRSALIATSDALYQALEAATSQEEIAAIGW